MRRKGTGRMKDQGYSITTQQFRLRCGHPEWLRQTQELYNQIEKFYYDLFLRHEELWRKNSQEILRSLEVLSLPGREKRRPQEPFPWEGIPPYFRRAAANAGIAGAKSFLSRTGKLHHTSPDEEGLDQIGSKNMDSEEEAGIGVVSEPCMREAGGTVSKGVGEAYGEVSASAFAASEAVPAAELRSPVVYYSRMYRDFSSERITLKVWDGTCWRWMGCRLKGKEFPENARAMSPTVVFEDRFIMLHVPIREPVRDISSVKERMEKGGNICGLQFTNGDAFAVASVRDSRGQETAVRFFNGGLEYRDHCRKILERIEKSENSLGRAPEGAVNQKYWMHLKHLSDHYAHQVSRSIVRFCEEQQVSVIALPKYREEYTWKVMKGSGNWGPLHLSTRIRSYLRYKAWKAGIIVIETHAQGTSSICARCGQPAEESEGNGKEFLCRMGHRGNWYLNTARNLAVKCRGQFEKQPDV